MNLVWVSVMIVGLGMLLIKHADIVFPTILSGSQKAIELSLKLWAIYAVWLGLLKIVEVTNLDKKIAKLLSPLIKLLIGNTDEYTKNQIAINISSSILGMGNASTPSGINAMMGLDKGSKYITNAMVMLLILNTSSLQLLPTTIIGLRAMQHSKNASDIIIPCFLSSLVSTSVGIILVKICGKIFKDKL